jgi:hypothetical protein
LAFLSAFLVAAKVGTVLLLSLTPEVASLSTITASFLISQTNEARRDVGLPSLEEHPLLAKSARLKADDMLKNDYFEHTSPAGVSPWKWFDTAGYVYVYAGENLAIDFTTGESVHTAWMRSPGHRRNIVSDTYRHIGIAVATGEFQGRTTTVVVQNFGSLSAAPASAKREPPTPTASPSAGPPPAAPRLTPPPSLLAPAAPEILEPSEGQLLPSGASTVRGTSSQDSTVRLSLDGKAAGTYTAPTGLFRGTFTPPPEEEREATLIATATLNGRRSPPSQPRHVQLDTRGPTIAEDSAIFLPDPRGALEELLLVVPVEGKPTRVTAKVGDTILPLTIRGSVASAEVAARALSQLIVVRAEDAHGNARVATVHPLRKFQVVPRTAGEADARARVLTMTRRLRTLSSVVLTVVALLLAINIFVYIRMQHADLIAHALFVVGLGALLVLIT